MRVTEPGANQIVSFAVSQSGRASLVNAFAVMGSGPFGLAFSQNSFALTANTANGAPNSGSMSCYRVSETAELAPVSPPVMDNQTASTWATVTGNGRIAFTSNTMSGTISSYVDSPKTGSLTLVQPTAASLVTEEGGSLIPAGMALSNDSRYLYVRNGGNQTVTGFLIHSDGLDAGRTRWRLPRHRSRNRCPLNVVTFLPAKAGARYDPAPALRRR